MRSILIFATSLFLINCHTPKDKPMNTTLSTDSTTHAGNPYYSRTDTTTLEVSNARWQEILPADLFAVARLKDTERPFTGKFWDYTGIGRYYCAVCGNHLFQSDAKFSSSCGWPSFFEAARQTSVKYVRDYSHGMDRIEVLCGRCDSHLGHIFDDGPPPTGKRFCMNSISLDFEPEKTTK